MAEKPKYDEPQGVGKDAHPIMWADVVSRGRLEKKLGAGARCVVERWTVDVPGSVTSTSTDAGSRRRVVVVKRLLSFANVAEERATLYREGRLQALAAGRGVVSLLGGDCCGCIPGERPESASGAAGSSRTAAERWPRRGQWNLLVREFVPGRTLLDVMHALEADTDTAVEAIDSDGWLRDLAGTLARLHGPASHRPGMYHRDVTPGNVVVSETGATHLNDFGLARLTDEPPLRETELLQGTPSCLPPEQVFGSQPGPPGDVYQLGLLRALLFRTEFRREFLDKGPPGERRIDRTRRIAYRAFEALADDPEWQACVHPDPARRPTAQSLEGLA